MVGSPPVRAVEEPRPRRGSLRLRRISRWSSLSPPSNQHRHLGHLDDSILRTTQVFVIESLMAPGPRFAAITNAISLSLKTTYSPHLTREFSRERSPDWSQTHLKHLRSSILRPPTPPDALRPPPPLHLPKKSDPAGALGGIYEVGEGSHPSPPGAVAAGESIVDGVLLSKPSLGQKAAWAHPNRDLDTSPPSERRSSCALRGVRHPRFRSLPAVDLPGAAGPFAPRGRARTMRRTASPR